MWKNWVIDASMEVPSDVAEGIFCFIPVEGELGSGDEQFVVGMNVVSDAPPHDGKCVGIIHEGGQEAVEAFYERHKAHLARFDFAN